MVSKRTHLLSQIFCPVKGSAMFGRVRHPLFFHPQHTWDLKYVSWGVESTSAEAMSRCSKICRNDGRFRGLLFLEGIEVGRDEELELPFPE